MSEKKGPHMTVMDNVTLAPRKVLHLRQHEAEERAVALLDRIGLAEKASEYPDRLSDVLSFRDCLSKVRRLLEKFMHPQLSPPDDIAFTV